MLGLLMGMATHTRLVIGTHSEISLQMRHWDPALLRSMLHKTGRSVHFRFQIYSHRLQVRFLC
jgi:hypothetical protein